MALGRRGYFTLSSDSWLVTRMVEPPLVVEIVDRFLDSGIEHDLIAERLMCEVVTLQVAQLSSMSLSSDA
jgi:hypothetical protein